jgi:hypothetical protein
MNTKNFLGSPAGMKKLLPVAALVAALIASSGCGTTGYKRSDDAAVNCQAAAVAVQSESLKLATTTDALNDLVNQPATDAKPQFLRFSAALDRLVSSAKSATNHINRVTRKRAAYFEVWDKEIATIGNEDIRRASQTRKAEVSALFDSAISSHVAAQSKLTPLISYLQDIRRELSTDLTRQGLTAAQPSVTKANESAKEVQTALTQSALDWDKLSARTASFRVLEVK